MAQGGTVQGTASQAVTPPALPTKGLADVVAASTAISDIDGRAGVLSYRGYDIHELAGAVSFEECAHLLHRGELPTRAQLADYTAELAAGRTLGPTTDALLRTAIVQSPPMEALRTLLSALSTDDPDALDASPAANHRKAARLVAQMPVLLAHYQAARSGAVVPTPDPALGTAGNLLLQITGERPDEHAARILDECLVLHADHTMNASTFAARVCAATLSDMHSSVTAAFGTLKGPLHGGANEQVMKMLDGVEAAAADHPGGATDAVRRDLVAETVRGKLAAGKKISGFGHRVYRTEDPRATHLRRMSQALAESTGDSRWYDMSAHMEQVVFEAKGLRPNVDFYAASVYRYLGIPTDLFTPVFAVSRMSGWTAHVIEQHTDNRLIRPDSEYVGPKPRHVLPIGERE